MKESEITKWERVSASLDMVLGPEFQHPYSGLLSQTPYQPLDIASSLNEYGYGSDSSNQSCYGSD